MLRIYDLKMFYRILLKYDNMSKFIPKWVAVQLHICFAQFKLILLFHRSHNLTFCFLMHLYLAAFRQLPESVDVLMELILQTIWTQP